MRGIAWIGLSSLEALTGRFLSVDSELGGEISVIIVDIFCWDPGVWGESSEKDRRIAARVRALQADSG